jgi:hypothetical protein
MRNYEREFVEALQNYLNNMTFTTYDGSVENIIGISVGKFPPRIPGYPFVLISPLGPDWETNVLGGTNRSRRTRKVKVLIELHYEHPDPETGIFKMSDIFTQMTENLLAQTRLLDEEMLEIIDTDYAYILADEEGNEDNKPDTIPDWGYKGVATITLEAQWRFH